MWDSDISSVVSVKVKPWTFTMYVDHASGVSLLSSR
jgi:hypothetical protein